MNAARWNYIKNLKPAAPRLVHESCRAGMIPDPRSALVGYDLPLIPYVEKPGRTYDIGRNAAKRHQRDDKRRQRAARVARLTPTNCRGPAAYALPKVG